ncbi:MAG: hypothetical protein IJR63_01920 [Synergistaceae bacterium]|nr:hypothetical protein [Synergistaceae bacterium]
MRKNLRVIVLVTVIALSLSAETGEAARKVILDTDMAYLNDDALAMFVLC